jgi:hypothetical protein
VGSNPTAPARIREAMKLYEAYYNDTDGYTYWAEQLIGIFDSKDKADKCILEEVESGEYNWRKLEDYSVRELELNQKL